MQELASNEIQFLVALLASEESEVHELKTEFDARYVNSEIVQVVLKGLISDGAISVTKYQGEECHDFDRSDSLNLIKDWGHFIKSQFQIFLTDDGYRRWETDGWGITTNRARQLMFANVGSSTRV